VIRGERKAEREVKEQNYYRVERSYGSFYRRSPLPFEVNAEQITAEYKDGVLEIRAPRSAQQQPQLQRIPLRLRAALPAQEDGHQRWSCSC
jgi:HSP20 family protein